MLKIFYQILTFSLIIPFSFLASCSNNQSGKKALAGISELITEKEPDEYAPANALLVLPRNPVQGESFRIVSTGGSNLLKAKIIVSGPSGKVESRQTKTGEELPCWRLDDFEGSPAGQYKVTLMIDDKEICSLEFVISEQTTASSRAATGKNAPVWNSSTETLYSAWVNALFKG